METGKQGSRIMLREYGATDHIVHNNRLTTTTPTRTKHLHSQEYEYKMFRIICHADF